MGSLIPFWNSYAEPGKGDCNAWSCINPNRLRLIGHILGDRGFKCRFYKGPVDGCDIFVAVVCAGDNILWACKVLPQTALLELSNSNAEFAPGIDRVREFELIEVKYD